MVRLFDHEYLERRRQVFAALTKVCTNGGSPAECAAMVHKHEADEVLATILGVLSDCLKYKLSSDDKCLKNRDMVSEVVKIADVCSTKLLFAAFDRVSSDLRVIRSTSNPNKALLLEGLMIDLGAKQSRPLAEYSL